MLQKIARPCFAKQLSSYVTSAPTIQRHKLLVTALKYSTT